MSELKNSILIGERIKKQRLLIGYSREKLAEMVDITPRFCYDLELGNKNMSVNTLLKLSTALNVSIDYLLFGSTFWSFHFRTYGTLAFSPAMSVNENSLPYTSS